MKAQKIITIIAIILFIVIISLASFVGIYKKEDYKVVSKVPNYVLGMEFTNKRVINLEIEKEESEEENNNEEVLTQKDYNEAVKVLKKRLGKLGIDQYRVILDKSNGNIQIVVPESDKTDDLIEHILQSGTFELKDSQTEEVLLDTNLIKSAKVVYGQTNTSTNVYLQIKFNKEGKEKLKEISKTYIKTTEQTIDNEENEENSEETEEIKKVTVFLNGESFVETYFGSEIPDGILNLTYGSGTDAEALQGYIDEANKEAAILNSGVLKTTYTETDYIQQSSITRKQIEIALYTILSILALMFIFFIIKLKTKGLLASVLQVGYIALLLLTLRYTNVKITIEGIFGVAIGVIINYIYTYIAFKNISLNYLKDVTAKFALKLIPVYVIAVILSFNKLANIFSIGMVLVWSVIIMYLYNLTLTQITLKTVKKNKKR